jgi:FAD/FMN-containing dehydrogenase
MAESTKAKKGGRLRWLIRVACLLFFVLAGFLHPIWFSLLTDRDTRVPLPEGELSDAGHQNPVQVSVQHIHAPATLEKQLRELLQLARKDDLAISIGGARHSMGGHTLYPGGISIDMSGLNQMELLDGDTLRVGSGARWKEVIEYLNAHDKSVGIMQSNNSFSVGGSISVNCHGWQFGRPPICDTVEGFRLMKADGAVVYCSREEHQELFSLVLGGYGLFGIILEVDLQVVPNKKYRVVQHVVSSVEAINLFDEEVAGKPDVAMAYGRMRVDAENFLDEMTISILYRDADGPTHQGDVQPAGLRRLRRHLFRGSIGNNYGKKLRWWAETKLQPLVQRDEIWRNDLMSEAVEVFENRKGNAVDILHEYFIPREGVDAFSIALRQIIPEEEADLLNVTIRHIEPDNDTFLRYADQQMFAFVMLFHQERDQAGDDKMAELTRRLIDAALAVQGRYYLPYRLHATPAQFEAAYPQARTFFELKRKYDPSEIFRNQFYEKYGTFHSVDK